MRFGRRPEESKGNDTPNEEMPETRPHSGRARRMGVLLFVALIWLAVNHYAPAPEDRFRAPAPTITPVSASDSLPLPTPLASPTLGR